MKTFTAGAFARMPAKSPHYVQAGTRSCKCTRSDRSR